MFVNKILFYFFNYFERIKWNSYYEQYRGRYDIDKSFRFNGPGIELYGDGRIILGSNSYIGRYSSIQSSQGCSVKIGKNCSISHYVMIYTENRLPDQNFSKTTRTQKADVNIGDYCCIGANTFIREGVNIGNNVVIGAHSVVTKDIPNFSVAAGVPAKVLRQIKS